MPIDHHESDLYVMDSLESREIIAKHGNRSSRFYSHLDRKYWLDVPFAYQPFWDDVERKSIARGGK